jgi:hypothetical protein
MFQSGAGDGEVALIFVFLDADNFIPAGPETAFVPLARN